jgi:hypothetical protein
LLSSPLIFFFLRGWLQHKQRIIATSSAAIGKTKSVFSFDVSRLLMVVSNLLHLAPLGVAKSTKILTQNKVAARIKIGYIEKNQAPQKHLRG